MFFSILLVVFVANFCMPQSVHSETSVQLYDSFAGNLNFVGTEATLRTESNDGDACAITSDATTASLNGIPNGAQIEAAYLYWAGSFSDHWSSTQETPVYTVSFEGETIQAESGRRYRVADDGTGHFAGVAEVTHIVANKGNGNYSLENLSVNNNNGYEGFFVPTQCGQETVLGGWSLLVVYSHEAEDFRVVNLFEGFLEFQYDSITLNPSNFEIPDSPINGKLAHVTWEGDPNLNGTDENLSFNENILFDNINPVNNQFNSKSTIVDPPDTDSYGVDFDAYDVSDYLVAGDTSYTSTYSSGQDLVLLNAEIISTTNVAVADLKLKKTAIGSGDANTQIDYFIDIANNGPRKEQGPINATDELPADTSFNSWSGSGWNCIETGETVTCQHDGPLASGESLPTLHLEATVGPSPSQTLTNTAWVNGTAFDNKPDNNSDNATIGPKPLRVVLANAAEEVDAGAISLIGTALGPPEKTATSTARNQKSIQTTITPSSDGAWLLDAVGAGEDGSFDPGTDQTERWDRSVDTATGAGSTYPNCTAGNPVTMNQDHSASGNTNRMAHAVVSLAPSSGQSITFDAASSQAGESVDNLQWAHELSGLGQQKLLLGIAIKDSGDDNNQVQSVTYNGESLTRVAKVSIISPNNREERVEIWYLDKTSAMLNHIRLLHDNQGLTCRSEPIEIKACADSECNELYSYEITVDFTSPNSANSDWNPDPVTFSGGTTTVDLTHTTNETVTLDATVTSPEATNPTQCFTYGGTETCELTFNNVGILLDGDDSDSDQESDITTQIAGKPTNTDPNATTQRVRVVRTDDETGACIPGLENTTQNATFSYLVPEADNGLKDNRVSITGETNTELNQNATNSTIELAFDNNGTAPFHFTSRDAGKYMLEVHMDIPVTNSSGVETDETIPATDRSNSFVVRPLAVFVDAVNAAGDSNPQAQNASGEKFVIAGKDFELQFQSLRWTSGRDDEDNNGLWDKCGDTKMNEAPNSDYARVPTWNMGEPNATLRKPAGGIDGNLTYKNGNVSFDQGKYQANATNVTYEEVGIIQIQKNSITNFMGKRVKSCSPYIGRFVPDHFNTTIDYHGSLNETCSNSFTYIGQNMTYGYANEPQLSIEAQNTANNTTNNYNGTFVHLEHDEVNINATKHDVAQNGTNEKPLAVKPYLKNGTILNKGGLDGTVTYLLSNNDKFQYIHNANSKVAPFGASLNLNATKIYDDKDDVNASGNPPYATIEPFGVQMRFGRLNILNAYGSELLDLKVPIRAQYYDGNGFTLNEDDQCTSLTLGNSTDSAEMELKNEIEDWQSANQTIELSGQQSNGTTEGIALRNAADNATTLNLNQGKAFLVLEAPGQDNTGYVHVRANLEDHSWLRYDWSGDGNYTDSPNATATFGIYKGNEHIIYQQETTWK